MLARALSLELTEACNYKCNMCAYWQVKTPKSIDEQKVYDLLDLVSGHPIQNITVTGGEPLLHPKWREIAQRLPQSARKFLCTNGSPILVKNHDVGALFDFITVSIDGATEDTFEKIRGYRHLGRIFSALEKIKSAHPDVKLELKMTIQRENFREVPDFFALAKQHSFIDAICLGIPDTSQQAFALTETGFNNSSYLKTLMLDPSETKEFAEIVELIQTVYADEISSRYLVEGDLNRFLQRFEYFNGMAEAPPARDCQIANNTIVLKADGSIKGCYFLDKTVSIETLRDAGTLMPHFNCVKGHSALMHPICKNCDQIDVVNPVFGAPAAAIL